MAFRTNKVPAIEERTVSGSSVSFNSAFALPLKACKVSFSATQAGSGDPSPSNSRAISGVSAIGLNANSTPVSVSLGEERFGGVLDVLTGVLTITHAILELDGSDDEVYTDYSSYSGFTLYVASAKSGTNLPCMANWLKSQVSFNEFGLRIGANSSRFYFLHITDNISGITDIATWRAYLSQHLLEIVYELAEPIIIQLSANELSSIIGNNTISTDTGTLEITFADLQEKSASGSVASFNTALAMPLSSCNIAVNAWQEGSGEPSPSNVRHIHGFDKLRIGMVNFNQITRNGNFSTLDGWSTFASYGAISVNNNECVYTFTDVANDPYSNSLRYGLYVVPGHKYFYTSDCYVTKLSKALIYNISNARLTEIEIANGWNRVQTIMNANISTEGNKSCYIGLSRCEGYNYQVGDTYKMKNVMCIDLTQMFGSRIADYLYNLESNQEGAGVAVFRQLFYKDYYNYNVGGTWVSVASVNGDSYPDYAEKNLGETVYGGSYNSVSGKLINDSEIYDMGDLPWRDDINGVFCAYMSDMELKTSYAFCSVAKLNNDATISTLQVGEFGTKYGNGGSVWFPRGSYNTANEFKTANVGNKIVVRIKTPIETNIGATPISTNIGNNTIFADTGDIDLTFKDLDIAKRGNFREVFKLPS